MATEYIKREDALNASKLVYILGVDADYIPIVLKMDIEEIPAADVMERKHGEWLAVDPAYEYYKCSECRKGTTFDMKPYNFCPNCGADMRGEP